MTPQDAHAVLYESQVCVTDRPSSLAAVYRPSWRVPVTALLVDACRGDRARREQLIVLNWAIRSERSAAALASFMIGQSTSHDVGVRYEPALVRAVNIAIGVGMLTSTGEWVTLTPAGRALLDSVSEHGLYADERATLAALPKALPFNAAQDLLRGRS